MNIYVLLEEIGLTKSEISIYLATLELGLSTTGKIVDRSNTTSSKIYEVLDKLTQKGLVSHIQKNNVKHFQAAPPEMLLSYLQEKKEKITKQTKELEQALPELRLRQELAKTTAQATIYEGIKGLQTAFEEALSKMDEKDEFLAMNIAQREQPANIFFEKFITNLKRRNIKTKLIFNEDMTSYAQKLKKNKLTQTKTILQTTPASINVLKDTTIIYPTNQKAHILFVIQDKNTAESFRKQFYHLWNQRVVVTKGFEAFEKMIHSIVDAKKPGETYNVLGAGIRQDKYAKEYETFFNNITKYTKKKKIIPRLLFEQNSKKVIKKYPQNYTEPHTQMRYLPYKVESPIEIFIEKEQAHIVVQEAEPTIITIQNKNVAKGFQEQFDALWKDA